MFFHHLQEEVPVAARPSRPTSTRARIVDQLRRGSLTAGALATRLGVTHNAVRLHLAALQREGLVREAGMQPTASRPATVYEIAPDAEAIYSRAYVPFVAELVRVLGERLSPPELDGVMHTVGRRIAHAQPRLHGDLAHRVSAASAVLEELGGLNTVERSGARYVIRGHGCLLSAASDGRPEVCRAMQSFLAELVDAPVRECCERGGRPRCCFEIDAPTSTRASA